MTLRHTYKLDIKTNCSNHSCLSLASGGDLQRGKTLKDKRSLGKLLGKKQQQQLDSYVQVLSPYLKLIPRKEIFMFVHQMLQWICMFFSLRLLYQRSTADIMQSEKICKVL